MKILVLKESVKFNLINNIIFRSNCHPLNITNKIICLFTNFLLRIKNLILKEQIRTYSVRTTDSQQNIAVAVYFGSRKIYFQAI